MLDAGRSEAEIPLVFCGNAGLGKIRNPNQIRMTEFKMFKTIQDEQRNKNNRWIEELHKKMA